MDDKPQNRELSLPAKIILVFIPLMVPLGLALMGILYFGSCQLTDESNASISRGQSKENFTLCLTYQTNGLTFGHSGFFHPIKIYEFILAGKPAKKRTVYTPTKLAMQPPLDAAEYLGKLTSGQIIVDMKEKMVSVSLMTDSGPFPGNRKYPLTFVSDQ